MINIITSFYTSNVDSMKDNERNNELKKCLENNLNNDNIKKIHLYIDDTEALNYINNLNSNKINIIDLGKKPLYSDLFGYAINNLQNEICMVTNSDIYLGDYDTNLLKKLDDKNTVFALTRHEHDLSYPLITSFNGSHDSFIFKSPINNTFLKHVQYVQHNWGSESVLLHELYTVGIKLYNPCMQIKIIHLHKSNLRESNRYRIREYNIRAVEPCTL